MPASSPPPLDALIIGAGLSGLAMLKRLRDLDFNVHVIEAGDGVGGTWFWNRYPGARCDVESLYYSYAFSDELRRDWTWSERYASQPEMLDYINHVADRFDLRSHISFETRVTGAAFDEQQCAWAVETDGGKTYDARFLISAVGNLSVSQLPHIRGIETFDGATYHTGRWPKEGVDFSGQRVGVIGTGSSGIQVIPYIAREAQHLTVFQRTANFSIPARNHVLTPERQAWIRDESAELRADAFHTAGGVHTFPTGERAVDVTNEALRAELERRWQSGGPGFASAYSDASSDLEANALVADYVRSKIREIVRDPITAELLCPDDHPIGSKRLCMDTDYFDTYNRENVELVSIRRTPIVEFGPKSIKTTTTEYVLDSVVFATGYDAITGAITRLDLRGTAGQPLKEKWIDGPQTYLGLASAGFPNLFMMTGPGSAAIFSNMAVSIEQHVEWISELLVVMRQDGLVYCEASVDAERWWGEHVQETAAKTLFLHAASWYLGANTPGKPRVFMPYVGGVSVYRLKCDEEARAGYPSFTLAGAR